MAGKGFVKLYESITRSSVWLESNETRLVWITMLVVANAEGIVEASVGGLAHLARVSKPECRAALDILEGPDDDSRSPEHEGRRVERFDGGWLVLNHAKYRARQTDRNAATAERMRRYRERKKAADSPGRVVTRNVTVVTRNESNERPVTHQKTEVRVQKQKAEAEADSHQHGAMPVTRDVTRSSRDVAEREDSAPPTLAPEDVADAANDSEVREIGVTVGPPAGSPEAARLYADPNPWIAEIDGRRAAYVAQLPYEQQHLVPPLNFGGRDQEVRADSRRTLVAALVALGLVGVVAVLEHAWARAARGELDPKFMATSMRSAGAWGMRVKEHGEFLVSEKRRSDRAAALANPPAEPEHEVMSADEFPELPNFAVPL